MDAVSHSNKPSTPSPVDHPTANNHGSDTPVAAVAGAAILPSLPPLPTVFEDFATANGTAIVENKAEVNPNSNPLNNKTTTTPLKTPEGYYSEEGVKGTADFLHSTLPYIASLASKFPIKLPEKATVMVNHDEALYEEGYDSDGQMPYFDKQADAGEDPDLYGKPSINLKPLLPEPSSVEAMEHTNVKQKAPPLLMFEDVRMSKLSVNELKTELKKRGCKLSGKKTELQARLLDALKNNILVSTTEEVDKRDSCMNGLAPTAF